MCLVVVNMMYSLWNVAEPRYVIPRHETEGSNELPTVVSQTETIEILGSGSAEVICFGTSHSPSVCNPRSFGVSERRYFYCFFVDRHGYAGNCLPNDTAWRHRKLDYSAAVLWQLEISHYSLVFHLPGDTKCILCPMFIGPCIILIVE